MQHTIIETVIHASALLKECKLDIEKISQEETILQLNKTHRLTYSPFRLQPKAIRKLFN